jgi:hypothetical protein
MIKPLTKFLTPLAVIVLAFSITVTALAQEGTGPVKFEGTVVTDEQYGELICYGSYYIQVTVDKVSEDSNNLLQDIESLEVCYGKEALNLQSQDKIEVYGFYYKELGPLQRCTRVVADRDPYYVCPIILEIFRINSQWQGRTSEPIAPEQFCAREKIMGDTTIYLSSVVASEKFIVEVKCGFSEPSKLNITPLCTIEQMPFHGTWLISVSFNTSELLLSDPCWVEFIIRTDVAPTISDQIWLPVGP